MGTTKKRKGAALHSSASADWGTPREGVDLARAVLGRIDFDAASDEVWNRIIGAATFYDGSKGRNTLSDPWPGSKIAGDRLLRGAERERDRLPGSCERTFLNPPGDLSGELVRAFWLALVERWCNAESDTGFYVGFTLEQLVSLQKSAGGAPSQWPSPLSPCVVTMVMRRRWRYLSEQRDGTIEEGDKPTHGSFVTLLPSHDARERAIQVGVMRAMAPRYGDLIVHGDPESMPLPAPVPNGLARGVADRVAGSLIAHRMAG